MFAPRSASTDPYGLERKRITSRASTSPNYYPAASTGGQSWDSLTSFYDLPQRSATAVPGAYRADRAESSAPWINSSCAPAPPPRSPSRSGTRSVASGFRAPALPSRSRAGSFSSSKAPTPELRAASSFQSAPRPSLAQRISSRIGAELVDINLISIALHHNAQSDWSTLSSTLISFTSSFLALHDLTPPGHPQSFASLSLLQGYISFLSGLQSRCTEYSAMAANMVSLARLSRDGEEVPDSVMQVSESVGRAEEGWRRVQVGYVEWVNGLTTSSQGLVRAAIEAGEPEGRVQQTLRAFHTSKVTLHGSLKAVFGSLNLLSSRGVAIATTLHFRKECSAEHYFREGEEDEVERVWMELRGEVESAKETLGRLERAVGEAGKQMGRWRDPEITKRSSSVRRMNRGR